MALLKRALLLRNNEIAVFTQFARYIVKCHQIYTLNWIKRFYRAKQKQWFGEKYRITGIEVDSVQFINFDFVMSGQEIKVL